MSAILRIQKDLTELTKTPLESCVVGPTSADNLYYWRAEMVGHPESPYRGGIFFLDIQFPVDYPAKPPKVAYKTKMYHPNVDGKGAIQLSILTDQWRSTLTIKNVLQTIYNSMINPTLDDSAASEVAQLYRTDSAKFDAIAKDWTRKYAM